MKAFVILLAGVSFAAFASAAVAADMPIEAPIVDTAPAAYDWTGFYLGVNGGYGFGTTDLTTISAVPDLDGMTDSFDTSGWLLGGTAGYNVQMGNILLGIEGDIDWSDISGSGHELDGINHDLAPSVASASIDWLGTVRGRLGFAADSFLIYATGGLAVAGLSGSVSDWPGGGESSGTQVGYTVGAGAEVALTDTVSLKAEYLYVDLGTKNYDIGSGVTADVHTTANIVRTGLNFKF